MFNRGFETVTHVKAVTHRPNLYKLMVCLLQELKPTLDELGILSPTDMGYDQPELALPNPYEMH